MLFPERPALHDLSGQTHSHLASITLNWLVKGGRREDTRTVSVSLRQAWRERKKKKKNLQPEHKVNSHGALQQGGWHWEAQLWSEPCT